MRKLLKITAENYSFVTVVEDIRKYLNKKTHDNFIDMKRSYLLFLDKATLCTPYYQHVIEICNFSVVYPIDGLRYDFSQEASKQVNARLIKFKRDLQNDCTIRK